MTRIYIIILLGLSVCLFSQEGIHFENLSYKELIAKAKKERKLLFIDAMASWCGPCKMMEKNTFTKTSVGNYYNSSFVNAQFDMEKGEGREIASRYGVNSYPTYLFINGDGQLVSKNYGFMPESTFLELGKEAQSFVNNANSMKQRFENGESDPEFLLNVMKLNQNSDVELAKKASERYFQVKKVKEYTREEIMNLLYHIKSANDPNYAIFKRDKEEIIKTMPEKAYDDFDHQIRLMTLSEQVINNTTKTINEEKYLTEATPLVGKEEAKITLNKLKLNYYEQNNNFDEYEKAALELYQNPDLADANELLKAGWNFSEKATKPKSLNKAQEWIERLIMNRGETMENTFVLAKLYLKSNKKDVALMYAELARDLAKKHNADGTPIEKLIQEIQK